MMIPVLKRCALPGLLLGLAALALPACSDDADTTEADPPSAELQVTVVYPNARAQGLTASLHLWVLAPLAEAEVTCSELVGGALNPYAVALERKADVVSKEVTQPLVAAATLGPAWIFVEAVGFDGTAEYAGCKQAEIAQPSTAVSIELDIARVFDCADPATKDGAPCYDGLRCTTGESCKAGRCQGGIPRDCTHLADQCNAESCDEEQGCIATPLPNTTPCDDGFFCTSGDLCRDGVCAGVERDCSQGLGTCEVSTGCNEALARCEVDYAPLGTSCDDGQLCTENDVCGYYGSCSGTPLDCSALEDQCNSSTCNSLTGECEALPLPFYYPCSDEDLCTLNDQCDGLGECSGTPRDCSFYDTQCHQGTCNPLTGVCEAVQVADNTPCDDGDPATTNDICTGGECAGSAL